MCGLILGISLKGKPINKQVLEQYEKQKSRGRQGFGVFDGDYNNLIRETKEDDILKWLRRYKSTDILFHHRLPTSTNNVKNACHPFSTRDHFDTNYILIHNGTIQNSFTLNRDHEEAGIEYYSTQKGGRKFNDSESLAWDVALYLEGKQTELKSYGAIAFICIAIKDGKKTLHFARNTSPLYMQVNKKRIFLASTQGIARTEVKAHTLYSFDLETKKLSEKKLHVKSYYNDHEPTPVVPRSSYTPGSIAATQHALAATNTRSAEEPKIEYEEDDYVVKDDVYDSSLESSRVKHLTTEYARYIKSAKGFYKAAILDLRKDIRNWEEAREDITSQEDLDDINETVSVLRSVKDMMICDPAYTTFNSRHKNYLPNEPEPKSVSILEMAAT